MFERLITNKLTLKVGLYPHLIDVTTRAFCFSPTKSVDITSEQILSLKTYLNNSGIKELTLKNCLFSEDSFKTLCDLIRVNDTLTSVDFSYIRVYNRYCSGYTRPCHELTDEHYLKLIDALQSQSNLNKFKNFKNVNLSIFIDRYRRRHSIGFKILLHIFDLICTGKLTSNITIFPHAIDANLGFIRYENELANRDLPFLLESLRSNVPIKRVECLGMTRLSLKGLISLYEIRSFNKSVEDLDTSPHLIDVDNGVFSFNSKKPIDVTFEISSLQSFLVRYNIKQLSLTKLCFPKNAISLLNDLLGQSHSLISVDLSGCVLSDLHFLTSSTIEKSRQSKHYPLNYLKILTFISLESLLLIFDQFKSHKSLQRMKVSDHVIHFDSKLIEYDKKITNEDLSALLKALKSNVPIKRVECRRLGDPSLKGLITLFEIGSIKQSVMGLDISPHCVDVENEVSSLQSVLNNSCVKKLTLKKCRFTNDTITILSDSIKINHSLTSLDISLCKLSDDNCKQIVVALQLTSSRLVTLSLASNSIGNEGVAALADSLKGNTSISELCLGGNCIGNEGAIALAEMMKENSSITTITLGSNSIGKAGVESLADALLMNSTVTSIKLFPIKIDSDEAENCAKVFDARIF
ncbi:hypothetical protein GEMRC1_009581 [Eukaryota sp. GEM-RC1]